MVESFSGKQHPYHTGYQANKAGGPSGSEPPSSGMKTSLPGMFENFSDKTLNWQQNLHLRRLTERIELEIDLRREGLRCLIFCVFTFCLCMLLTVSTTTPERNASRWLIEQGLGLDAMDNVALPSEMYEFIVKVSKASRKFIPLSSDYIPDPLAAVLLNHRQDFASGPLSVPAGAQPRLRLEWAVTAWVGFRDPGLLRQDRAPIVRKRLPGDGSALSCWAWLAEGPLTFLLEYGRHNMDDGYAEVRLDLSGSGAQLPAPGEMRLASVSVNGTHARAHLQGASGAHEAAAELPAGAPTDCPGGVMELGHPQISLADVKFHPRQLTVEQFEDVMEGGQTLENIATGVAEGAAPELSKADAPAGEDSGGGAGEAALTRAIGDLVNASWADLSSTLALLLPPPGSGDAEATGDPEGAGVLFDSVVGLMPFEVVSADAGARAGGGGPSPVGLAVLPVNLSGAFAELSAAGAGSFTLAWWARAGHALRNLHELVFTSPAGQPRLKVDFAVDDVFAGKQGWKFQFYNSPFCFGLGAAGMGPAFRAQCRRSPSWWCEAPSEPMFGGTYDGIWRHFGLRFTHAEADAAEGAGPRSRLELFLDGNVLCGADFAASEALLPHGGPGSPSQVIFGTYEPEGPEDRIANKRLLVKDMRLYNRSLGDAEMRALGLDPQHRECLNLEEISDNPHFRTPFGLSCTELGSLSTGADTAVPVACSGSSPEVAANCPVSCLGAAAPACWGRLPPRRGSAVPPPVAPSTATYSGPRMFMVDIYPSGGADADAALRDAQQWSTGITAVGQATDPSALRGIASDWPRHSDGPLRVPAAPRRAASRSPLPGSPMAGAADRAAPLDQPP